MWRYTCIPQYAFMAWYVIKHRDKFTFNFTRVTESMGAFRTLWLQQFEVTADRVTAVCMSELIHKIYSPILRTQHEVSREGLESSTPWHNATDDSRT
jgi:hypothetical protein